MTYEEFIASDRVFMDLVARSKRAAEARSRLPAGSSRARVTSANARWTRAAEARDARARWLREVYETSAGSTVATSTSDTAADANTSGAILARPPIPQPVPHEFATKK